jgi:hypothetical protein
MFSAGRVPRGSLRHINYLRQRPIPQCVIRIVYVSTAAVAFADKDLRALLARARERNAAVGVTGMLLHHDGAFMQVLEGAPDAVDVVFARIGRDPRHRHVVLLDRRDADERSFPDWSMGFIDVYGTAQRLPGFRAVSDLVALAGNRAEIDRIVGAFRNGRWHQSTAP